MISTSKTEREPEQKHAELRGIARGASIGIASKVFRNGMLFVFAIMAARLLGDETFGVYMLALGTVTVSVQLSMLGLDRGAVKFVARYVGEGDEARLKGTLVLALMFGCVTGIVAAIVLYSLSSFFSLKVYEEPGMVSALSLMACGVPFHIIMFISLATTRGFKEMRSTSIVEDIVQPTTNLLLFAALAKGGSGIMAGAWSYFVSVFLGMVLALFVVWRKHPAFHSSVKTKYSPRSLLATSVPLGLAAMAGWLYTWLSTLILGNAAEGAEVAVFQVALRTTFLLVFISMPFNLMIAPVFSDLFNKGDMKALRSVYRTVSRWILAASAPLAVSIIVLSRDWMGLFGGSFETGTKCLIIVAVATLANGTFGPSFWLLQMCGRQVTAMIATVVFIGTLAVSAVVFSNMYGAVGAAIATATAVAVFDLLLAVVVGKHFGFHFLSKSLLKILVAAMVCLAVGYGVRGVFDGPVGLFYLFVRLTIKSAVIGLSYLGVVLLLRLESDDLALLNSIRHPMVVKLVGVFQRYGIAK